LKCAIKCELADSGLLAIRCLTIAENLGSDTPMTNSEPYTQNRPNDYDAADDFAESLDEAYRVIRERKAAGGEGWKPK